MPGRGEIGYHPGGQPASIPNIIGQVPIEEFAHFVAEGRVRGA